MIQDRIHTRFARLPTKKSPYGFRTLWCQPSCAPWGPMFSSGAAARRRGAPRRARAWKVGPQLVVWPAACTPTGWRWLRRAGKSYVHGTPRCGSRCLEAEWLGPFDWWQAGMLGLDSQRCWRLCGGSSSSLVTARCRRCSVTAGSSSSAAVVEAAARSRRSSAPQQTQDGMPSKASSLCRVREVLHHSARLTRTLSALKTIALSECEDHHWNRTKRDSCSGTKTGPI